MSGLYRAIAGARFATASFLLHVIIVILAGSVVLVESFSPTQDFVAGTGELLGENEVSAPPEDEAMQPTIELSEPQVSSPGLDLVLTANTASFAMPASPQVVRGIGNILDGKVAELGKGLSRGMGGGKPGGTAMSFFGTKAKASSVVFVVDVSGSMISGEKSVKTYGVLEKEIARVIRSLNAQSRFGIVVFSRDALRYKEELIRANNEEKERAMNWLRKLSPERGRDRNATEEEREFHHGTRADRGLDEAFAMKPDVIFFVSDGEPTGKRPTEILQQVIEAQKPLESPVIINAVAYLADSGLAFMKELAKQTRGEYREVNPKDLN